MENILPEVSIKTLDQFIDDLRGRIYDKHHFDNSSFIEYEKDFTHDGNVYFGQVTAQFYINNRGIKFSDLHVHVNGESELCDETMTEMVKVKVWGI